MGTSGLGLCPGSYASGIMESCQRECERVQGRLMYRFSSCSKMSMETTWIGSRHGNGVHIGPTNADQCHCRNGHSLILQASFKIVMEL